jgi:type II secretory pathway component GspD/PulD (secretin)
MLFPSFAFNEETGDFVISGFDDEKDLGVKLTVIPHINQQGDIVVDLLPQIASFVGIQTLDASRGIVAPIFTTREAHAEVMVRDGDTIMLGGLITKETSEEKTKIPLLGDVPFIGDYFFSFTEKTVDRTELIIFITVHLIKDKWATHLDPSTAYVPMPVPKDAETFMAIPKTGRERKKKWWQFW